MIVIIKGRFCSYIDEFAGSDQMLQSLTSFLTKLTQKYLPDAYVLAIGLTIITILLGVLIEGQSPINMIVFWGESFFDFLSFAMQMALVLISGVVIANVPFVKKGIQRIAQLATTPLQGYVLTFVVSFILYYINWGIGIALSAFFAQAVYKKIKKIDFPFLIACSYTAFHIVFPIGLASSIPLLIATPGHFAEGEIGIIATSQTMFHPANLIIGLAVFVTVLILIKLIAPKEDQMVMPEMPELEDETAASNEELVVEKTFGERLEGSFTLSLIMGLIGVVYVIYHFSIGGSLNLNIVILGFLSLGIIMHKKPINLVRSFNSAGTVVPPIILQFPIYAGIMGMLINSGLAATIAELFVSISSESTFPLFTYWSAGFLNIFVPSGGGQWGVQAPIQIAAASELGVSHAVTSMAVAWGDAWTNIIQPFWAIPILTLVGLKIKDIMGYCVVFAIAVGIITSLVMLFVY